MILRIGQTIRARDGEFGEVADIVADPVAKDVTHVIVEPHHHHIQARLVPVSVLEQDGDELVADMDLEQIRRLPRAAFSEFLRLGAPIDVGDAWDIADEIVVAQPYWSDTYIGGADPWTDQTHVLFDRIPKGECEIRRRSRVVDTDGHVVGHVEGLVVSGEHVTGVVIRSGPPGLRHLVVAPLATVASVGEEICLSIDRAAFDLLSGADGLLAPDAASIPSPLQSHVATIVSHAARRLRRLRRRLTGHDGRDAGDADQRGSSANAG